MQKRRNDRNPHGICTLKDIKECAECEIKDHLKCRFKNTHFLSFIGSFLIFAIPAVMGLIISGFGWFLLGWLAYALFFFNFWETRILCRHCPYYAEESKTLHCIANYGCYKLWKYDPHPMSTSEKFQLLLGFIILGGYPFIFFIIAQEYIFFIITLGGLLVFFSLLLIKTCSKCVNFSCPLNRVPKRVVNEYLKRNTTMKQAWEEDGYILEN